MAEGDKAYDRIEELNRLRSAYVKETNEIKYNIKIITEKGGLILKWFEGLGMLPVPEAHPELKDCLAGLGAYLKKYPMLRPDELRSAMDEYKKDLEKRLERLAEQREEIERLGSELSNAYDSWLNDIRKH